MVVTAAAHLRRMIPRWPVNCRQIGERLQCQGNPLDPVRVKGLDKIGVKVVWHLTPLHGNSQTGILHTSDQGFYLQPGQEGERASWTESVWHGASHVLSGLDHILFILTLTLLYRFGIPLLKAVAGFTLGHSLTLALASLELVSPPSAAIELLIALSILILVRETLNPETSRLKDSPSLLSCVFGLLHGFGFAGGLVQTGLPLNQQLWELLWFNMGVEAAQIAILSFSLTILFIAEKIVRHNHMKAGLGYSLGAIAGYWTVERTWIWFNAITQ